MIYLDNLLKELTQLREAYGNIQVTCNETGDGEVRHLRIHLRKEHGVASIDFKEGRRLTKKQLVKLRPNETIDTVYRALGHVSPSKWGKK